MYLRQAAAMITSKRINDVVVKAIPKPKDTDLPPRSAKMFPATYWNVFLLARKNSGKTTAIFEIMKRCVTKETTVVVFSSTVYKDNAWVQMKAWCKKKKLPFLGYTSIVDDNGADVLEALRKSMTNYEEKDDKEEQPEQKTEQHLKVAGAGNHWVKVEEKVAVEPVEKKTKPKYAPLDWLIIFDDIGNELRRPSVAQLVKMHRHVHANVILSSQFPTDLNPGTRRQLDYWLLFPKLSEENLRMVYKSGQFPVTEQQFYQLYKASDQGKYPFLYVATHPTEFRRRFDEKLMLPGEAAQSGGAPKKAKRKLPIKLVRKLFRLLNLPRRKTRAPR